MGGAPIIAGNERVLRARFSDARHFWDADRRVRLADRVRALDAVIFHAKLGSQGARVHRIMQLAEGDRTRRRGRPGIGRARRMAGQGGPHHGHGRRVSRVARRHGPLLRPARRRRSGRRRRRSRPLRAEGAGGRSANSPRNGGRGRWPTSSTCSPVFSRSGRSRPGPATRTRCAGAALGVVRIIREGRRRLQLRPLITLCAASLPAAPPADRGARLHRRPRPGAAAPAEGAPARTCWTRCSQPAAATIWPPCSLCPNRWGPCSAPEDGRSLLVAHKRAANILRIETAKDGRMTARPTRRCSACRRSTRSGQQIDQVAPNWNPGWNGRLHRGDAGACLATAIFGRFFSIGSP